MTKQATTLYADIDKIDVPPGLRKLDQNHVDTIAASAKAKRLFVPVLLKAGKGDRFILEDGQHRLAAMKQNGEKRIKYELVDDADAGDVANMVRKQYSFAERIKVITQRKADADSVLASALGVSERKVKQYRALAALPQVIIDSVEAEFITEGMAQRATALPANMLKELADSLKRGEVPNWAESAEDMKHAIERRRIPIHAALFDVEASGLKYERDLFDADAGYFQDEKAFLQHQLRAVEKIAGSLTSKVKIIKGHDNDWYGYDPVHRGTAAAIDAALTPQALILATNLRKQIDSLQKKLKGNKDGLGVDMADAIDAAKAKYDRLIERPDSYDPTKLSGARVLAKIDKDGTVEFRIFRKQKPAAAAPTAKGKAGAKTDAPKKPLEPHTRKAWAIARDQRDLLIQEAMLANQTFGLRVVLASLLTSGNFGVRLEDDPIRTEVPEHAARAKAIVVPERRASFTEVWTRVCGIEAAELIAEIVRTVTPFNYHGTDVAQMQQEDKVRREILREAIICVEAPPLPYDYFAAHQTAQLLAILAKVKGKKEAELYTGRPKNAVAAAVQDACLEAAWLPDLLDAIPDVKAPKKPKKAAKPTPAKRAA